MQRRRIEGQRIHRLVPQDLARLQVKKPCQKAPKHAEQQGLGLFLSQLRLQAGNPHLPLPWI